MEATAAMETEKKIKELNEIGAKVMGWKMPYPDRWRPFYYKDGKEVIERLDWTPATDIGQAFMVLRELKKDGWSYMIEETCSISSFIQGVNVVLIKSVHPPHALDFDWWEKIPEEDKASVGADHPALAIMRAVKEAINETPKSP